ncbi:hypothetical protein BU23DRAFT_491502 [Bimuria novae-zelandiae CBS 107.79]|uniref:MARVEL domain-containing protein n=1 Tax=Bimuria novae-zelandiae CBS 107.79 TaxID=1447943 RepID=A0A6A5UUS7_9PLEO|nr:hypothetical protein BU23DRAFT_491502 [Bimuria novae-zelandiae CBS 107.79]
MSFSGLSFILWRMLEILTLIPTMGMLAWFVHIYDSRGFRTPTEILVLFIVSTLGVAWTIGTLFLYSRAKHSASFVAFVDLLFVGAFIGAVYELRAMGDADCSNWRRGNNHSASFLGVTITGAFPNLDVDKSCAMLKASWVFGIINCILFFFTFILALLVHRHYDSRDRVVVKRETHYHHRGSRSHRSRSPRHSHHSHRSRSYV